MNFNEQIEFYAQVSPKKVAMIMEQNIITYGQLIVFVNSVSKRVSELGLQRGSRVAVMINDPNYALIVILALFKQGMIVIPANSPNVLKPELSLTTIISDRVLEDPEQNSLCKIIDDSWFSGADGSLDSSYGPGYEKDSDICLASLSSGTTGKAKVIGFTVEQFKHRIWTFPGMSPPYGMLQVRDMINIGLETTRGLAYRLARVMGGGILFNFPRNAGPFIWLKAINLNCIEQIMTTPRMLSGLLNAQDKIGARCPSLKTVMVGGAYLNPQLSQIAQRMLCRNIIVPYGSTEAGLISSGHAHIIEKTEGSVGTLFPWVEAQAVDEADNTLSAGLEGAIRLRVPEAYGVTSYFVNPQEEEDAKNLRNGWFYPGDLGYVTAQRELVIKGRQSELINIGGNKISPDKIEEVLLQYPGIRDVAAFGVKNNIGLENVHAAIVGLDTATDELKQFCIQHLGAFTPKNFIFVDDIPRNEMGKIRRWELKKMVE